MQETKGRIAVSDKGRICAYLAERGIIKEQELYLSDHAAIVYGYNNSGKTTLLKELNWLFDRWAMDGFLGKGDYLLSNYIPTNRVIVNATSTDGRVLKDIEDLINYKKDIYSGYSLHLKNIRDNLFGYPYIVRFVSEAVGRMFDMKISDFRQTYSDGIENIINIYANIIWILTWNQELSAFDEAAFQTMMKNSCAQILVDEIEMFLHVSIQNRLIGCLKSDFPQCRFLFTTHSPLLLSRYRNAEVFQIEEGLVKPIERDLYYEDLDKIYEIYFRVSELPEGLREEMNDLGDFVLGSKSVDRERVMRITSNIRDQYPNIYRKYHVLIVKAKDRAGL